MKSARVQFALCVVAALVSIVVLAAEETVQSKAAHFPDLIPLPANFGPEGIAVGNGYTFT